MAHLEDAANGLNVTVALLETFDGEHDNSFTFTLSGSAATAARPYTVRLIVSPDDPDGLEASWETNVTGPEGESTVNATVAVPAETLPYRQTNVPFRVAILAGPQDPVDEVDFSMDLTYHPPPPDGGLFQLAGGTIAAWGLVLLYAVYLHRAHQRLRARTDSLERALGHSGKEGEK